MCFNRNNTSIYFFALQLEFASTGIISCALWISCLFHWLKHWSRLNSKHCLKKTQNTISSDIHTRRQRQPIGSSLVSIRAQVAFGLLSWFKVAKVRWTVALWKSLTNWSWLAWLCKSDWDELGNKWWEWIAPFLVTWPGTCFPNTCSDRPSETRTPQNQAAQRKKEREKKDILGFENGIVVIELKC